jgi:hypothetical protein
MLNYKKGSLFAIMAMASVIASAQTYTGKTVEFYANCVDPLALSFNNQNGDLFVGRDNTGSGGGGGDALRIHRIVYNSGIGVEYGNDPIYDPDGVLFDANGTITGVAGSVMVFGGGPGPNGFIEVIRPDQSIFNLVTAFALGNPASQVFEPGGNSLITTDQENGFVNRVTAGGVVTTIATLSNGSAFGATVDPNTGDIFVNGTDGVVRHFDSAGNLLNGNFFSGLNFNAFLFWGSGMFGNQLMIKNGSTIMTVDGLGNATTVGTGWDTIGAMTIGPDGYLYISEFNNDRVMRVVPEPATMIALGAGLAAIAARRRRK